MTPETRAAIRAAAEHADDPVYEVARVLVVALDNGAGAWIRRTLGRLRRVDPHADPDADFNAHAPGVLAVLRRLARESIRAFDAAIAPRTMATMHDSAERAIAAMLAIGDGCREWNEAAREYADELRTTEKRRRHFG